MAQEFLQAYEDHIWDVYGYFAYRALPAADAEDLTQLTFERALRAWERFDPRRASVRTWLLAIARNAYIDHRRRNPSGRQRSIDSDEVSERELPTHAGPQERLGQAELGERGHARRGRGPQDLGCGGGSGAGRACAGVARRGRSGLGAAGSAALVRRAGAAAGLRGCHSIPPGTGTSRGDRTSPDASCAS